MASFHIFQAVLKLEAVIYNTLLPSHTLFPVLREEGPNMYV